MSNPTLAPKVRSQAQLNDQNARNLIVSLAGMGLLTGAGFRGAMGLRELFSRQQVPMPVYPDPISIPMPENEKEKRAAGPSFLDRVKGMLPDNPLPKSWQNYGNPAMDARVISLGVPLGALGLYGGYKGMDYLLDSQRKRTLDAELEQARKNYEALLRDPNVKLAADQTPDPEAQMLDEIAEHLSKQADWGSSAANIGLGTYGLYALGTGLGAGSLAYSFFRNRAPNSVLSKALRARALVRDERAVAPIYAQPMLLSEEEEKAAASEYDDEKKRKAEAKKEEKHQARTKLGPLEHAYVADAVGARAMQNAARKHQQMHLDPDNPYQGGYDRWLTMQGGINEDLAERINRGASRMAESPTWRILSLLDPTRQDSSEGLIGALSGFGGGADRAEGAKRRAGEAYAKFLKKHQAKVDLSVPTTQRETPFHIHGQGWLANLDSDIAGQTYMRRERPLHYWLNPLSKAGPLAELGDRGMRRMFAAYAYPESTRGRAGMGAGGIATLGLLPLVVGGEAAQQKLRASAVKNQLYAPEAMPEVMPVAKSAPSDAPGVKEKEAGVKAANVGMHNLWAEKTNPHWKKLKNQADAVNFTADTPQENADIAEGFIGQALDANPDLMAHQLELMPRRRWLGLRAGHPIDGQFVNMFNTNPKTHDEDHATAGYVAFDPRHYPEELAYALSGLEDPRWINKYLKPVPGSDRLTNEDKLLEHILGGMDKTSADRIPGGLADNKPDSAFKRKALRQGIKVEREHTSSKTVAKEIAKDHLTEDPSYYPKLQKMETKEAFLIPAALGGLLGLAGQVKGRSAGERAGRGAILGIGTDLGAAGGALAGDSGA